MIIFLPLKESLTLSRYGFFCYTFTYVVHLELSRIELPKLTSSILMEIVTILVLVDQFYFYMHQPKTLGFLKKLSLS